MSDETRVSGTIRITPPVPAHRLAGSEFVPGPAYDDELAVRLCISTTDRPSNADRAFPTEGYGAVQAAADEDGRMKDAHQLVPHLNRLLTLIGPGHDYDGVISCAGPDGDEDLWRVRIVDGAAIDEDADVVYPADWTAPAGPAVTCNADAARAWFHERMLAGARDADPEPAGDGPPFGAAHQPSHLLCRLLAVLGSGAAPQVWRCQPNVGVEVVETMNPLGVPDGGAVLVVTVAGVRLASKRLTAHDLIGSHRSSGDLTADGHGTGVHDLGSVAVAVLGRAAEIAAAVVQRYRTAQLAVPPFALEQAAVLLDALGELHRSTAQPWTVHRDPRHGQSPGSALRYRGGYERTMRQADRVLRRLIDREAAHRGGLCWHSIADFDRHGMPGITQVAVSSRSDDDSDVICWVVDRAGVSRWRLTRVGVDDGRFNADDGVAFGDTYSDAETARQAAELFEATSPTGPTDLGDTPVDGDPARGADSIVDDA
ncbi:DUF6205 family protein [Dactylosporangium cerinum]|uniref:DUF6205 family protein n=1 Tax=Dactylosporangium cerinum TaxID=1434730 RepID=A0ABV9WF45_9ACTN